MAKEDYASVRWTGVQHEKTLCGNDRTTLLFTPTAASATGQTTISNTGKHETFGRAVRIKKLLYLVDTATTAGDATTSKLNLLVYKGTTVQSTLTVTTEAALAIATSSDLNIDLEATDYIRIYSNSIQTESAKAAAIGMLQVTYEERFLNA